MKFLHRNKRGVSAGAFTESAYEVLNYEQLLKVNGAGGGSGGSGSGGPSGPSSSSGSSSSSSGYGSCGGSTISSGSGYSSCGGGNNSTNSGYSSCGGGSNSGGKIVENSNSGVANANVGDIIIRTDGTVVTLTQADITWAQEQVNKENAATSSPSTTTNTETTTASTTTTATDSSSTSTSNSSNTNGSSSGTQSSTTKVETSATNKIEDAIKQIGKKDYTKGEYMCDDYVEDVIKKAGYDPKDYYVDDPSGKNVNKHISELTSSDNKDYTTDATQLTEGTYVVFMSDNEGEKDSHASLLVVDSNGSAYMRDNSSHNNATDWDDNGKAIAWAGGTETTNGLNAYDVCSKYTGYENFYFQKLK